MFFQISIDKNGVVTGGYQNVLSGEKSPISGQVDKKTQRGGLENRLEQHRHRNRIAEPDSGCRQLPTSFRPDTTQTWLLVRLKQPEMPDAPQSTSGVLTRQLSS
jgi:hypothetical protein